MRVGHQIGSHKLTLMTLLEMVIFDIEIYGNELKSTVNVERCKRFAKLKYIHEVEGKAAQAQVGDRFSKDTYNYFYSLQCLKIVFSSNFS